MVLHLPGTLWSSTKHYVVKQRDHSVGPVDERHLHDILDAYDDETVFIHAGLSDVKTAFGRDPYELVRETFQEHFDSLLTPGFTSSFRETGRYHKTESTPEVGAFSRLFFEDADYRTDDAIHSILVAGDYRFEDCDHHDTFAEDGCYGKLDADNVRYINIGTPWFICTQIHYVEECFDVPYMERVGYEGFIEDDIGQREPVTQVNYDKNKWVYYWNRLGLQRDLMVDGVLDHFDLNGLKLLTVGARDLREAVLPRLETDPYYLVR